MFVKLICYNQATMAEARNDQIEVTHRLSGETPHSAVRPNGQPSVSVEAAVSGDFPEFEETLKRLVDRIAKILQAHKCVFLLHSAERDELFAVTPALGLTYEQIARCRIPMSLDCISTRVFNSGNPVIVPDTTSDQAAVAEKMAELFEAASAVSVPLVIEKRDDDNRVVERETIGVLHVFDKSVGQMFTKEDVRLLVRMSFSAASIITSAQIFREAVQEKQELIHTIESLYLGLVVIGRNGRVLQMNASARLILGIPDGLQVIGVTYTSVLFSEKLAAYVKRSLAGPTPVEVTGEVSISTTTPGDDEPIRTHLSGPVRARARRTTKAGRHGGHRALLLLNDITEIRNVERMKTAFISTVSHELRTPLTSIKGFIATLLADTEGFYDHETQREFFRIIDSECDRLTRLIADLLDMSRIEHGKAMQMNIEPISIPAIADKVVISQRAYANADTHTLAVEFPADFPIIEADSDKVDQILTNLVNNAIKYSPQGGSVRVIGSKADSSIEIRIVDQGMGIPRDHLKKIF